LLWLQKVNIMMLKNLWMNGQHNCDNMNYKQLWQEINKNNINKQYYGVPSNVRSYGRFIKQQLLLEKQKNLPQGLVDSFDVIYEADVKIYQPVNNTAFFHDKFRDMFIFFDITNQNNPKAILAITGLEIEQINNFNNFLRTIKRNKWVI